jgi:hypothetical protein
VLGDLDVGVEADAAALPLGILVGQRRQSVCDSMGSVLAMPAPLEYHSSRA